MTTTYVLSVIGLSLMRSRPRTCVPQQHPANVEVATRQQSKLRPLSASKITKVNAARPVIEVPSVASPLPTPAVHARPRKTIPPEVVTPIAIIRRAGAYAAVDEGLDADKDPASCSPATLPLEGKD